MRQDRAVDGFRLAYERTGQAGQGAKNPAVLVLHGWPGDRTDYRKREWTRWVEEAKKPETRARRIAKTVQSLREAQPAP